MKRLLRPALFILGGALAGYLYYSFFGCTTGCPITSSPVNTMAYMALLGWLLHLITKKENSRPCNT